MKRTVLLFVVTMLACLGLYAAASGETVSTSLSGAKDLSVRIGETICIRKSDFRLDPDNSLINGTCSYRDAEFDLYAYNYLFRGYADYSTEYTEDGDKLIWITPNVVDYYPVYAYASYYDENDDTTYSVDSDYFTLTVLDEYGNEPEPMPISAEIFPIPTVTVGETLQINWSGEGYYPLSNTIQILRNGNIIDSWDFEATYVDTYTFTEAGTYRIRVVLTDGIGRSAADEKEIQVVQPKSLILNSLTLQPRRSSESGTCFAGFIEWTLDYEGGYGTKVTEIHLINTLTEEDSILYDSGFYPSFSAEVGGGTFYLRMIVKDDEGDHEITSNMLAVKGRPDWDFLLPVNTKRIESDAFAYTDARFVQINDGCTFIGANAFAHSSVKAVFIPATVTYIGSNAIPEGTTIYVMYNSWVEDWALDNGYEVVFGGK